MAASTTDFSIPVTVPASTVPWVHSSHHHHRRISPEAGRALEILGHAIEYLTDEYIHEGGALSANDPQVQAVQMLMALNRQIYFECPVIQTFGERLRGLFRLSRA